jgi:hypothetical protein
MVTRTSLGEITQLEVRFPSSKAYEQILPSVGNVSALVSTTYTGDSRFCSMQVVSRQQGSYVCIVGLRSN